MEHVDTVVIGAGQAGLATSFFLTQHDREHVVLERGQVGETWRSQRWDGFYLNTPNSTQRLPGYEYSGEEPDAFAPRAEVVACLEGYAASFDAPVRDHANVTALRFEGDRFMLETDEATIEARNVVVTTGAFQQSKPRVPGFDDATIELQLTTSQYRRPEQLADGAVLVVGGGQSGCQITDELVRAGRDVYLAIGRCGWFPRRYRGRDMLDWAADLGLLDQTVDSLPSPAARLACNPPISGNDGGHDCHPRWLAGRGAVVVGRLEGVDGTKATFAGGVEETLAAGDGFAAETMSGIDRYIAEHGLDAPGAEPREGGPSPTPDTPELDLRDAVITSVIWAAGFRPDYSWIALDVADEYGWPVQRRGISEHPGLYFVGVNWLHKRKSALFCGVGDDAEHVVSELVGRG
jgi:putative flavoprotein involved in K+ transport